MKNFFSGVVAGVAAGMVFYALLVGSEVPRGKPQADDLGARLEAASNCLCDTCCRELDRLEAERDLDRREGEQE